MRPTVAKQWFDFSSRLAREEALQNCKMLRERLLGNRTGPLMVYQLTHEREGIRMIIWAAWIFSLLVLQQLQFLVSFPRIFYFFYSTDEKFEQTTKLILTITDTKRIIKWVFCKIWRIKISVAIFLIHMFAGVFHGNILCQALTSCTFNYLSWYLLTVLNATSWIPKLLYYMHWTISHAFFDSPVWGFHLWFLQNLCTK